MKATTEFDEITVFGARGHSLMILRGLEEAWLGRVRIRALIDDIENGFLHPELGIPVISSAERLQRYLDLPILLTPGSPALRARMAAQFADEGAIFATACHPGQIHVDPAAVYGAGSLCSPLTRIGPGVGIGAGAQVLGTVVGHDVLIGAFTTVGFGCMISGHVTIGEGVTLAPNAVIANGTRARPLRIGDGAVIGVGAAVLRDVAPGARMVGNPAMPMRDWIRLRRLISGQSGQGSR
ncbi:LbetaH domain-containing protein [Pseudogemmobacter bohemicus]|uniref:acetyltransferase n=1 Tax=Pseudogemmobacter bohemicus TaxID=2250708 RepID=UPI000DD3A5D4|nr:acetyltransferase [Pseudogemmobacter bohemicus]